MATINLPEIKSILSWDGTNPKSATIHSEELVKIVGENHAETITAMVLAQFCAGIDITSKNYKESLVVVLDAISNSSTEDEGTHEAIKLGQIADEFNRAAPLPDQEWEAKYDQALRNLYDYAKGLIAAHGLSINNNVIEQCFKLDDIETKGNVLAGKVKVTEKGLSISLEGYSDFNSVNWDDSGVVVLEYNNGVPLVSVYSDINKEAASDVINLSDASETKQQESAA